MICAICVRVFVCVCVAHILGMCPKGDDPLTTFTDYRTIVLNTSVATGYLNGTFKFTFNGESFYFPADALLWNEEQCKLSFESLNNVQSVTCTRGTVQHSNASSYTIQLLSFPIYPYENNIYTHFGDPPLSSFSCDPSHIDQKHGHNVQCTISEVVGTSYPGISFIVVLSNSVFTSDASPPRIIFRVCVLF